MTETEDVTAGKDAAGKDTTERTDPRSNRLGYAVAGVLVVIALGAATRFLEQEVPGWAAGTPLAKVAKSIEFPVYAIALGLIGNVVLSKLALREALSRGFRTEFFIKTGLVLLGASINLKLLVTAAGPAIIQALLLITIVFGFTWWLGADSVWTTNCGRCWPPRCRSAGSARPSPPRARCRPNANSWPTRRPW